MMNTKGKLTVIDGETLMDKRLAPTAFCVDTLLPQGITMLGGAPKIGKSWLVLDLCLHIAKGVPFWGLDTRQGTVLYLCLEDSQRRLQERLNHLTDEAPPNLFFATGQMTLQEGVLEWIRQFVREHPETVLVAIDTFQMIREGGADPSYGRDYAEMQPLRALADELGIALLLVHHLRKQGDRDPLNKLSGTTGISGAVDAVYILDKCERTKDTAYLVVTGRDVPDRKLHLRRCRETGHWELLSDSLEEGELMPAEMEKLILWAKKVSFFSGGNTELAQRLNAEMGLTLSPKALKQMMNRWRYPLEAKGVLFESRRSNGQRFIEVCYVEPTVTQVTELPGADTVASLSSLVGSA